MHLGERRRLDIGVGPLRRAAEHVVIAELDIEDQMRDAGASARDVCSCPGVAQERQQERQDLHGTLRVSECF